MDMYKKEDMEKIKKFFNIIKSKIIEVYYVAKFSIEISKEMLNDGE